MRSKRRRLGEEESRRLGHKELKQWKRDKRLKEEEGQQKGVEMEKRQGHQMGGRLATDELRRKKTEG